MSQLGRILTQREWMSVFAEAFRLPSAEFTTRVDVHALDAALEAPAAHHRGVPIHLSLAEQAAAQTEAMLRRPPVPAARRAVAYLSLELFIEHSGGRLEMTSAQRDAFMNETASAIPTRERLTSWIGDRLRENVARVTRQSGSLAAPTPVVYIALPVCSVCGDDDACRHLRSLAEAIREAIERFAIERGWPGVRVEVAALPYLGAADLEREELGLEEFHEAVRQLTEVSPDSALRQMMLIGLRTSDALVMIGGEHPSFGGGNEFARMASTAANLYLHQREAPCSRWLDDEPGFCFLRVRHQVGDHHATVGLVVEWLMDRAGLIEAHWRRRQTRLLRWGPVAVTFAETWGSMSSGRARVEAFASTGLPVDRFQELLSPDGVATASGEELDAMCRGLGLSPESLQVQAKTRSFVLSSGQRTWLVRFADEVGITREMERALEAEAERQMALGVLRYALASLDDWYAFAREVAHDRLG